MTKLYLLKEKHLHYLKINMNLHLKMFNIQNKSRLKSDKHSLIKDDNGNIYEVENFIYLIGKKTLKGKKCKCII